MAEQVQKCSKCGNTISQGEGMQIKNGLLCPNCAKKRKNRNIFGAAGGGAIAIAAALGITLGTNNKVDSFEGVGKIKDDVVVENIEAKTFDISKSVAISSPTSVAEAIDDIVLFKSKVSNAVDSKTAGDTKVEIPSIAALFTLNSAELSATSKDLISEFAKFYCQTNKEAIISVEGYTCDLGSSEINDVLSIERANAVKDVLVSNGVPSDKISVKGFGKSMYGKLGLSGREANRRANISIK